MFAESDIYSYYLKNTQGHYVDGESIVKHGCGTVIYISFKTVSPACKAYISKDKATEALGKLNNNKDKYMVDDVFHIEYLNRDKLFEEYKAFKGKGDNMIVKKYYDNDRGMLRLA